MSHVTPGEPTVEIVQYFRVVGAEILVGKFKAQHKVMYDIQMQ
jgi:hypothetical protein